MKSEIASMQSINRIRLEFKVLKELYSIISDTSINRIRLEFKDNGDKQELYEDVVLIESDWNLKDTKDCIIVVPAGINRIRLEFKDGCFQGNQ